MLVRHGAAGSITHYPLSDNVHVVIKILTGQATRLNREHKLLELEVRQRLSSMMTPNDHCARLLTHFVHPGFDDDGEPFLSPYPEADAEALAARYCALACIGMLIINTFVNYSQISNQLIIIFIFDLDRHWSTEAIDYWLNENPPRTYPPERRW